MWIVRLYDTEWYQCTNFRIIPSVSALAQQEKNPSFLVVKIHQKKARHRSGALFSLRSSLPKNNDPYVFCRSAMGRPKSSDILWVDILKMPWCDTLLRDFTHLRVTRYISVCGMSSFFSFYTISAESVAKIIFETSARQHFSDVFWDAVSWYYFNLEIVPGLSFQHRWAPLADKCRS